MRNFIVFAALALATLAPPFALPLAAQDLPQAPAAWAAAEREVMVPVEGGNVWMRVNGDLEAEALPAVFVHGGPGGTHVGFGRFTTLADERAVIMYDQLDSGMSEHPNDSANWRVERFVEELDAVRRALDVERWHIVGHSWGSALALEYAARYPQHTASTVLGGTFISTTHWITDANMLLRELPADVRETVHACEGDEPPSPADCGAAFTLVYSQYYEPTKRDAGSARYAEAYGGKGFNPVLYNTMWGPSEFAATGSLRGYDATLKLLDIDGSRTLFMIGQYDSARIDTVQEFIALAPGSELAVIPGGAHGFTGDRPDETEAILRGWLARMDEKEGNE